MIQSRYIENKTDYNLNVVVKDTHNDKLLDAIILPGHKNFFRIDFDDDQYHFNHMTKLYVSIKVNGDTFSTLFSSYEVDTGIDILFNTYPIISVYFELEGCSYYLIGNNP
ncbi:hypothetical protein [Xenorhabdus taiwanensis]|uniref:Uncharacterized protein n=1 Tax=Xenorhabdus taiwanensis TaxID=3085177 RepID=A0ABM8JXL5_9GAMM|nr:hypothetical protein TCT1_23500 [Xenorhabdus sp. TCT-1]